MAEETQQEKDAAAAKSALEKMTPAELQAALATANKEKADLLKETMSRKQELKDLNDKLAKQKQDELTEQGKWKELHDGLKPKAERLDAVEATIKEILELEIADVPADKRELIPAGTPEAQLKWVKTAKAKGLFNAPQEPNPKKPPVNPKGKGVEGKEFLTWSVDDPRLKTMSTSEYQEWKAYQQTQQTASPAKGW